MSSVNDKKAPRMDVLDQLLSISSPTDERFTAFPTSPPLKTELVVKPTKHPARSPSNRPTFKPIGNIDHIFTETPSNSPSFPETPTPSYAPSSLPSGSSSPSIFPSSPPSFSSAPSVSPTTHQPSDVPSTSTMPTESVVPSLTPSLTPSSSLMPSTSELPSEMPTSTHQPSGAPSTSTMPTESAMPSLGPSMTPSSSTMPSVSNFPSEMPSSSLLPSAVPSVSIAPSETPSLSQVPSQWPSESLSPSNLPSHIPSALPSSNPSLQPSSLPSTSPSASPTGTPSSSPSTSPSSQPSPQPTAAPSVFPSAVPTLVCHDNRFYRSPINGLDCEVHQGTDCTKWRFVGLSVDELEELITSCPESCKIDCGDFAQFLVSVSYQISGIPRLLDFTSVAALEEATLDYLESFVSDNERSSTFVIDMVELLSQQLTIPARRRMRSMEIQTRSRNLDAAPPILKVTVEFHGFTLRLEPEKVADDIVAGIDSPGYTTAIRQSGDPIFARAQASAAAKRDPSDEGPYADDDGRKRPTTATLAVVILVSISLVFLCLGSFVYHRRSGKWIPFPAVIRRQKERDQQRPRSPDTPSEPDQQGSLFSYEDSTESSGRHLQAGASGILRLLGSLSRSKDSTSPSTGDQLTSHDGTGEPSGIRMRDTADSEDDDDGDKEGSNDEEEEHPLSMIIPPMIVIDHIENDEEINHDRQEKWRGRGPVMVPSKRMEASSDMKAVLADCSVLHHPGAFAGMLQDADTSGWKYTEQGWVRKDDNGDFFYFNIGDDAVSVASTPAMTTRLGSELPPRRSRSSSALDEIDSPETLEDIELISLAQLSSASATVGPTRPQNIQFFHNLEDTSSLDPSLSLSSPRTPSSAEATTFHHPIGYSSNRGGPPPQAHATAAGVTLESNRPIQAPPEGDRLPQVPPDGGRLIQALWTLSPIGKGPSPLMRKRPSLSSSRPADNLASTAGGQLKTIKQKDQGSLDRSINSDEEGQAVLNDPTHSRTSSKSSLCLSTGRGSVDGDTIFEFGVPRKVKLGLVVEPNSEGSALVRTVKDYSPLFGHVLPEDRIVEVDGIPTSNMKVSEVTKLLAVKPGRRGAGTLRISISRPALQHTMASSSELPTVPETADQQRDDFGTADVKEVTTRQNSNPRISCAANQNDGDDDDLFASFL